MIQRGVAGGRGGGGIGGITRAKEKNQVEGLMVGTEVFKMEDQVRLRRPESRFTLLECLRISKDSRNLKMTTPEVTTLMEMGFTAEKAEKALSITGNKGVEPAMEWLLSHSEDEVETPQENKEEKKENKTEEKESEAEKQDEAKSIKCNDCNRLFDSYLNVEYHAVKTGHSDFSESTDEKKPLTEEEKKEQLRLLEEKMKQKRKEREEKERKDEVEREKRRIQSSKEIAAAKEKMKEIEMKKLIEQHKREKIEDQKARERVKAQIEADKLARKMKVKDENPSSTQTTTSPVTAVPPKPQKDYSETKLQIRLTNGETLTQTFGSKEQLSAVRLYIEMNRTDGSEPFSIMTNFPRKIFNDEDFEKPLQALGLAPSAVIIVSRKM